MWILTWWKICVKMARVALGHECSEITDPSLSGYLLCVCVLYFWPSTFTPSVSKSKDLWARH